MPLLLVKEAYLLILKLQLEGWASNQHTSRNLLKYSSKTEAEAPPFPSASLQLVSISQKGACTLDLGFAATA